MEDASQLWSRRKVYYLYTVSQKTAKLFLSELRQISTHFDNFWQKDGKEADIMRSALNLHLT